MEFGTACHRFLQQQPGRIRISKPGQGPAQSDGNDRGVVAIVVGAVALQQDLQRGFGRGAGVNEVDEKANRRVSAFPRVRDEKRIEGVELPELDGPESGVHDGPRLG